MSHGRLQLESSWKARVGDYFDRPDMRQLSDYLKMRQQQGHVIYPSGKDMFAAFDYTPFDQVKAVIVGQDPYHGPGQAHGLCFSVRPGVRIPPSLNNIYAEIERDLGIDRPDHGCLLPWANRGVLLLNSVLTVEKGQAGSHRGRGWEGFTDYVIAKLNAERENLVFLLWGKYAKDKGYVLDKVRHKVLHAPHPSPFSAHRGFMGCNHFSTTNHYLVTHGIAEIDWSLPGRAALHLT